MTTRSPGGRREITVYTDSGGQVRRYMETVHRMTGRTGSEGETVAAAVTDAGEVRGMRMRITVTMKLPPGQRFDTAFLRTMRERATTKGESEPLGAEDRAKVRTLAAWLVKRCAA
jgi:hypothetical protein